MKQVNVRGRRRLLNDVFAVDEVEVSFERFDGTMTPPVRRLVFERGDSVAAVVLHRDSNRLLLTEQFRFPTYDKGPGWMTELIAGVIDPGEEPALAMRREIEEELGYRPDQVEPICGFYLSPGGSSERVFLYYAEVTEVGRVSDGGGVPNENEDIRVVSWSVDEAHVALLRGGINDAKTIVGLQWMLARRGLSASR